MADVDQRPTLGFLSPAGGCPVSQTLRILGGKHKPNILHALSGGERHFLELSRDLPEISRKVLTEQLRSLEKAGLVERVEKNDARRHVAYDLTSRALELGAIVSQLSQWNQAQPYSSPSSEDLQQG